MSGLARRGGQGRENVDTVRGLLGRLASDDPRGMAELLDPEVELVTAKPLAGAGTFQGQPGFLRWLERWEAAWERESLWIAMVEPVGPRHVVAMVRQRARSQAPGEGEATVTYMCELRGGLPVRLHAYPSREEAIAAARACD